MSEERAALEKKIEELETKNAEAQKAYDAACVVQEEAIKAMKAAGKDKQSISMVRRQGVVRRQGGSGRSP